MRCELAKDEDAPDWRAGLVRKTGVACGLDGHLSRLGRLELFGVLAGARNVCCVPVQEATIAIVQEWCRRRGLTAVVSPDRYAPIFEPSKANYANAAKTGGFIAGDIPHRDIFISLVPEYAKIARVTRYDDRAFGHVMGYPSCCVEFYIQWLKRQAHCRNDFVLPSIDHLGRYSYLNNVMLRYFGISLVSHFPCSLDCSQTRAIARRNLKHLRRHAPEVANLFARHLRSLVVYTEQDGIAYFPAHRMGRKRVSFARSYCISGTRLAHVLADHGEIKVVGFNHFAVGEHHFREDCRVALFE